MRGSLLTLVVISLTACPPVIEPQCSRFLVDTNGNPNGGFAGGPGQTTVTPVAYAGVPLSLTVFAPLSACEGDAVRADISAIDPDNESLTPEQPEDVVRLSSGIVRAVVTLTPTKVGLHSVKVAFEPSLGARTVLVDVALDGLKTRNLANSLAQLEDNAAMLTQLSREKRHDLLQETAPAGDITVHALRTTDGFRWLERTANHIWRICHYLAQGRIENGKAPAADETTSDPLHDPAESRHNQRASQ